MHCNKAHYVFNLWVGKGLPIFTTHRITQGGIDVKQIWAVKKSDITVILRLTFNLYITKTKIWQHYDNYLI